MRLTKPKTNKQHVVRQNYEYPNECSKKYKYEAPNWNEDSPPSAKQNSR